MVATEHFFVDLPQDYKSNLPITYCSSGVSSVLNSCPKIATGLFLILGLRLGLCLKYSKTKVKSKASKTLCCTHQAKGWCEAADGPSK